MSTPAPRIAVLGISLESNALALPTTAADFYSCYWSEGADLRQELVETDVYGITEKLTVYNFDIVPTLVAGAEAGGPLHHPDFVAMSDRIDAMLRDAGPIDGVLIFGHGAGTTTENDDLDGDYFMRVRRRVGDRTPIIAVLDFHANISRMMFEAVNAIIGFRENPHTDIKERNREACDLMAHLLAGRRLLRKWIRLPLITPQVCQLTAPGYPVHDLRLRADRLLATGIANISIFPGFALSDTKDNGFSILVTSFDDQADPTAAALELAQKAWADRDRYRPNLVKLATAINFAQEQGHPDAPIILADVADNPGGGGRGNTMWLLAALLEADIPFAAVGLIYDATIVDAAHNAAPGSTIDIRFNAAEQSEFSQPLDAVADVVALRSGTFKATRGAVAGDIIDLGKSCLLKIGRTLVAVVSKRQQIFGADYLEYFGVDCATIGVFVVKSRGHFRAGFEHLVPSDRVLEVDLPGLTPASIDRIPRSRLTRPIHPLDALDTVLPYP